MLANKLQEQTSRDQRNRESGSPRAAQCSAPDPLGGPPVTNPKSNDRVSRSRLVVVSYNLVWILTAYALFANNITLATNDYRSVILQAVASSSAALLASVLIWRRVPTMGRAVLLMCTLANLWTLVDAGGRRLLQLVEW